MSHICSFLPLQLFESGQLLCLESDDRAGLILQLPHYAVFVGVGAAVGGSFDVKCVSVYTLGDVKFRAPDMRSERQQAYQKRMEYIKKQQKITYLLAPLQRAYLMIRQLSLWLHPAEVLEIPDELISQLAGVLPKTVAMARQQFCQNQHYHTQHEQHDRYFAGQSQLQEEISQVIQIANAPVTSIY